MCIKRGSSAQNSGDNANPGGQALNARSASLARRAPTTARIPLVNLPPDQDRRASIASRGTGVSGSEPPGTRRGSLIPVAEHDPRVGALPKTSSGNTQGTWVPPPSWNEEPAGRSSNDALNTCPVFRPGPVAPRDDVRPGSTYGMKGVGILPTAQNTPRQSIQDLRQAPFNRGGAASPLQLNPVVADKAAC